MTYTVCDAVKRRLEDSNLTDSQKAVVIRCVWGYTEKQDYLTEKVERSAYRFNQYWNDFPDWKESVAILSTRKITIKMDSVNPTAELLTGLLTATVDSNFSLKINGKDYLERLIQTNAASTP